jgi:hypothetical protein
MLVKKDKISISGSYYFANILCTYCIIFTGHKYKNTSLTIRKLANNDENGQVLAYKFYNFRSGKCCAIIFNW